MDPAKMKCLIRSWGHSREEDADGLTVYRPVGYRFPVSRGRDGLEFRSDGTVVHTGPGPDDRTRDTAGSWQSAGDQALDVRVDPLQASPRRMTIVDCDDDILKVRWD